MALSLKEQGIILNLASDRIRTLNHLAAEPGFQDPRYRSIIDDQITDLLHLKTSVRELANV